MEEALFAWLSELRDSMIEGERPIAIHNEHGRHVILYGVDEHGQRYASIQFELPSHVTVEVDEDDAMVGFRIYIESEPTILEIEAS